MSAEWSELIRLFVLLSGLFILTEFAVVGIQLWLVARNGKLGRHLSLGTLTVGLLGVPATLGTLIVLAGGP